MRCDLLQRVLNCVGVEPVILVGAMLLVVPSACTAPPPKPMAHYQAVATTNFTPRTEVVRTIEVPVPVPQAATPSLPTSIEPGQFTAVSIPGHRAATVVHGQAQTTRALVYLHGICGQVSRIRDWAPAASEFVTTVAPMGNKPCPESNSRFSWNQDIELIHQLIDKALMAVSEVRNGRLDTTAVVLFGYSQGASRAERLVERYPERYRWVILGGPPRHPTFERFRGVLGLALLVGTEEHQTELGMLAEDFTNRGVRTHFDQFTGVGHGFFGPSAPEVMRRTLLWFEFSDASPATRIGPL